MNINKLVYSDDEQKRLDHYLVTIFPDLSRSRIQKMIKNTIIMVNNFGVKTGYQLQNNDIITIEQIDNGADIPEIVPEKIPLEIVYEDDSILVINKPSGLIVHPGTGQSSGTLVHGLKYHYNELSTVNGPLRPGIIHRLDQETSGLIVTAKTDKAHRIIADQFQNRLVSKTYVGLTWGEWKENEGVINAAISRNRKDPTSYHVDASGKSAETHYKVLSFFRYMSFLEFYPKTGRTHQIRVHCQHVHRPIVHDMKYKGGFNRTKGFLPEVQKDLKKMVKQLGRHALHAKKISFCHPETGKVVKFETELPADMQALLDHLKQHYG